MTRIIPPVAGRREVHRPEIGGQRVTLAFDLDRDTAVVLVEGVVDLPVAVLFRIVARATVGVVGVELDSHDRRCWVVERTGVVAGRAPVVERRGVGLPGEPPTRGVPSHVDVVSEWRVGPVPGVGPLDAERADRADRIKVDREGVQSLRAEGVCW